MHQPHTLRLATWARLIVLSLLLGLGVLASLGLATRTAHAQPAATSSVSTCDETTLRNAITSAGSGDTISFGCSGTITLSSPLVINKNLTLDGSGRSVTLDGGNSVQVLVVNSGITFTLNALTVANGTAPGSHGGGLDNKGGTVSITNSTVTNNSSSNGGGGLGNNNGRVSISNSTFANNSANSGGGIENGGGGTVSISNSTFANNSTGGFESFGGTVNIGGSIIAENTGGDCLNRIGSSIITDRGYNLSSDSSCGFTGTGSLQNSDPKLGPLANNGGPTQTMALVDSSPAIDAIPTVSCPATDQRGVTRPDNGETTCDIGAYEFVDPPDHDLALTNMPSDITVNATSSQGAVVNYTLPTVVDEDSPLPTVSCTSLSGLTSGSTFPIGSTTVTCTATDSDDTNSPVSGSFQVVVKDVTAPVLSVPSTITDNASSSQGAVVNYTVTATDPDNLSSDLTISCSPASGSTFVIGTTTVNCSASDPSGNSSSGSFQVVVNPVLTASGTSVSATEGSAFTGVVATGTDGTANPLTASINWGDGSTSAGTITLNANGSYSVSGSHTYAEEGSYALTVMVTDGTLKATGSDSATVSDAALSANTPTVVIKGVAVALSTSFTDADPNGTLSDYTASISWGDGSTLVAILGKNSSGSGFVAVGAHNYVKHGTYTITVTIKDAGGSTVTKTVTIKV